MKFSAIAFAAIVALVEAAVPAGTKFGLVSIRSGSPVQYASASLNSDNQVVLGATVSSSDDYLTAVNVGDGSLSIEGTDLYLGLNSDKALVATSTPSKIFSFSDDRYLAIDGSDAITAVSESSYYSVYAGAVTTDKTTYGIALLITSAVTGSSSSSAAASSAAASSSAATTATQSAPAVVSSAAPSTTLAQVNGAASKGSVFAAAVAAVGGALLL
ncbi:uncharacterized protein SAPINGB_P004567 [Magnusiomyces paraingens]|uniref:Cell wall protein CWP1 n=1 Tax=Magnusiomyces paraingens TaxID=2606893 RepID=A0A5E8BXM5_9ASCO|nr:uncharacterized protein SAPINGB_P004567 [Saprochaete ingens]VVT55379.1 unnamed protein product [Saprochaete ingens]